MGAFLQFDADNVTSDGTVGVWHIRESGAIESERGKFADLLECSHPVNPDEAERLAQMLTAVGVSGRINS